MTVHVHRNGRNLPILEKHNRWNHLTRLGAIGVKLLVAISNSVAKWKLTLVRQLGSILPEKLINLGFVNLIIYHKKTTMEIQICFLRGKIRNLQFLPIHQISTKVFHWIARLFFNTLFYYRYFENKTIHLINRNENIQFTIVKKLLNSKDIEHWIVTEKFHFLQIKIWIGISYLFLTWLYLFQRPTVKLSYSAHHNSYIQEILKMRKNNNNNNNNNNKIL